MSDPVQSRCIRNGTNSSGKRDFLRRRSLTVQGGSPKIGRPIHTEPVSLVEFKEKESIMATRKILAIALAMALGVTPSLAQQTNGIISGSADDEANQPYSDYSVQLRDPATGQIVSTVQLTRRDSSHSTMSRSSRRLLVELINVKDKSTVCTEGPFVLAPGQASKTDVNIDCGKKVPTSLWILAAGAGTAAAIGLANNDSNPPAVPLARRTSCPVTPQVASPSQ